MSRIDFYHLKRQTLEEVLPKLLQKAYATGNRIMLKLPPEKVEEINTFLWTYNDESFLPHGSKKDGFADEQPIWLTDGDNNANNAQFLFLACGAQCNVGQSGAFERVFNVFDGNDESALEQARQQWKTYKDAGFDVHYWQQTEAGVWEQKA